jgi:hypothetical protein
MPEKILRTEHLVGRNNLRLRPCPDLHDDEHEHGTFLVAAPFQFGSTYNLEKRKLWQPLKAKE